MDSADVGFELVRSRLQGDFALIHDAARIKYEVYNDCNLEEIGEPFADQPYAVAVQQGSHLQVFYYNWKFTLLAQCGNLRIFLILKFYVKLIFEDFNK